MLSAIPSSSTTTTTQSQHQQQASPPTASISPAATGYCGVCPEEVTTAAPSQLSISDNKAEVTGITSNSTTTRMPPNSAPPPSYHQPYTRPHISSNIHSLPVSNNTTTATAMDNNNNSSTNAQHTAAGGHSHSTTTDAFPQQHSFRNHHPVSSAAAPPPPLPPSKMMTAAPAVPWTLGSTNGDLAMQLALLSQQEAGGVAIGTTSTAIDADAAAATDATNSKMTNPAAAGAEEMATENGGGSSVMSSAVSCSTSSSPVSYNELSMQPGGAATVTTATSGSNDDEGPPMNSHVPQSCSSAKHNISLGGNRRVVHVNDPIKALRHHQSLHQECLIQQAFNGVELLLGVSCEVMGFDIAELWLRTGLKTHQLVNSYLRPASLEESARQDLVDVYYGEKSSERTHRLSPALCKRAKEAGDVVWVSAHHQQGADALRCSISNVRTAVAIPVCHEASNTNLTIIFFSIRRIIGRPESVEFLVHMALASGVAAVNSLWENGLLDHDHHRATQTRLTAAASIGIPGMNGHHHWNNTTLSSQSEHGPYSSSPRQHQRGGAEVGIVNMKYHHHQPRLDRYSVTGARLDMQWRELRNVEYLTDGGNSWIHTAVFNGRSVVVKTLKPECQDVAVAINEIEAELSIHSRLHHTNIVELLGAGTTSKGVRFVVLERLDGGTLTQRLGYDTRIRDRRRRFWRKKQFSYVDVLRIASSIAKAMAFCQVEAIPGCVVLHRDLKPDNIGFTLDGTVKILDFGLAKILENASVNSGEVYSMSGETGSLRYMAPEVADALPYNHLADVYSFGIILWELNAGKKPFDGLNRELFYERVVHGGERPAIHRKWPRELTSLMSECWDVDMKNRPKFRDIAQRLDGMLNIEKGGIDIKKKLTLPKLSGIVDRHSTWF